MRGVGLKLTAHVGPHGPQLRRGSLTLPPVCAGDDMGFGRSASLHGPNSATRRDSCQGRRDSASLQQRVAAPFALNSCEELMRTASLRSSGSIPGASPPHAPARSGPGPASCGAPRLAERTLLARLPPSLTCL